MKERKARKAAGHGGIEEAAPTTVLIEDKPRTGQREQPKRKDRVKPRTTPGEDANPGMTARIEEDPGPARPAAPKPKPKPTKPKK